MKYSQQYSIKLLCETLGVCRSAYYAYESSQKHPCKREKLDQNLIENIHEIHRKSRATYGSPRVHTALKNQGLQCGENRVARLMKQESLRGVQKKRNRAKSTDSKHENPISANKLKGRNFPSTTNEVWVSDTTFIAIEQ